MQDPTAGRAQQGEIRVQLSAPPVGGRVRLLLFDSADSFDGLRRAVRIEEFPADGRSFFVLSGVAPGEYAVLVHLDEDEDGALDRNLIGIPVEPIAFSNGYRPLGPPSYRRARFELGEDENRSFDLELRRPLGERGLLSVGLGVIAQSSPYVDYDGAVFQPIPAITYIGDRVQVFGPNLRVRLAGSDRLRLGATARYRIGAYEEDDSQALLGLGDREGTLMAGLSLTYDMPANVEVELAYEHDVLDEIGGGEARLFLERPFQASVARLSPRVGLRWLDSEIADYDFGVPIEQALPGRPAYAPGDSLNLELGLRTSVEITRSWRLILDFGAQFLDDAIGRSPIVEEDVLYQGFAALSFAF